MTPAARHAAAIEVLDRILSGAPAEQALTHWARTHRFAGSGDRAAIRDHVFDVLRARRSLAALGGGETGRALVLGLLRRGGNDPSTVFGAGGHAPAALTPEEATGGRPPAGAEAADLPDWLWPLWQEALGPEALSTAQAMRDRAELHLRVNLSRTSRAAARARLADEGIAADPHPEVETGLVVRDHPRRLAASATFADGWCEVQDAASQIAVARLPLRGGLRVLDYCAGGGGKSLAIADRLGGPVWAHDIDAGRMADIPARAARAGAEIRTVPTGHLPDLPPFDLVFCDAPCSGSGTWRRTPDAKWRLTPERLRDLNAMQDDVLSRGAALCAGGGRLAYATCSVLPGENTAVVDRFLRRTPGWLREDEMHLRPTGLHDGFYLAILGRT